jgi:hypothetical protein
VVVAVGSFGCGGDDPPAASSRTTAQGAADEDAPQDCLDAWRTRQTAPVHCEEYPATYDSIVAERPPAQLTEPGHGDRVAGVYLAVARGSDGGAEAEAAMARVREDGYEASTGSIACDEGAAQQLGLPSTEYTATVVYFRDRADALAFVDQYEPGVVGIAEVTILCAD